MARYRVLLLTILVTLSGVTAWVAYGVTTEGEITPNDEFFELSIGRAPKVGEDSWSLTVDGHVENALVLDYGQLTALHSIDVTATLKCVEGPSGTALWRGVPLRDVLANASVRDGAVDVVFHAMDGYSSSLSLEDAMEPDVILCYGMNGERLPRSQGFPLKVVVPGKAGYKWVKWIERVEVVDYDHLGFWESRGWDDDADLAMWADWAPHALLLSLAAVVGSFSALGGLRSSRETEFWRDLPEWFTKTLHVRVSWSFMAILYAAFTYWTVATFIRRGDLFYSSHGVLALLTVSLLTLGLATGLLLERGKERVRTYHFIANIMGYLLIVGTIVVGLIII